MRNNLTYAAVASFTFILVGLGVHVAGFITTYWITSESTVESDGSVTKISIGLWNMQLELSNGTTLQTDSPIAKKEEQYMVLVIAAVNAALCFIVLLKAVHVCVGLVSFVSVAMMLIAAFFVYYNIDAQRQSLQQSHPEWSNTKLSTSLYLTFVGIILNILATVCFLTLLLIREERKAAKSTKGLGVDNGNYENLNLRSNDVLEKNHIYENVDSTAIAVTTYNSKSHINTPSVTVISGGNDFVYENAGYNSMQHSVYAGPSGEDNFNHIHEESSRL